MKNLNDCKNYFKDLYMNCLESNAFRKSIFESTERAQYESLYDALAFIYGAAFLGIVNTWQQEALNEFYGALAK